MRSGDERGEMQQNGRMRGTERMKIGTGFPSIMLETLETPKAGGSGRLGVGLGAVSFGRLHVP